MGSQTHERSALSATWVRPVATGLAISLCLLSSVATLVEWSGPLRAPDFWASFRAAMVADAIWAVACPFYVYQIMFRWHSRLDGLQRLLDLSLIIMVGSQILVRPDIPLGFDISDAGRTMWLVGLGGLMIVGGRLMWLIAVEKRRMANYV